MIKSWRMLLGIAAICILTATSLVAAEGPTQPEFTVPDDLRFELLLNEPDVRQPVHISFDERGRLWVVQYLQYPSPAGLTLLSRDSVWRVQYDKVPPPPPNHFPGADRITIHEDTDGDGRFDSQKTFVEGLNIATSVCRGRGGVWVTNPPYLLFYEDQNNDDVPDGDPEVHLEGFGLEDTHAVVNSLCWGPDGWLYGAQGSTVTGDVRRPGSIDKTVHSIGQLIWRYHPETKRYEVFAEGGGNAFGVEIDTAGRVFSGHNGGNTRGFHYMQGAYLQKGFEKHGPLSNPYAFGYFPAMKHNEVQRFTHTFVIYDADQLPERYRGKLFGVAPLLHHVVISEVESDGSTFQTHDVGFAAESSDLRFVPVDIEQGPDGALYVADWYDDQCNHYRNHEGHIDKSTGRIYRLQAKDAPPYKHDDLSNLSSDELVARLRHANKWHRQTALRLLADRRDASVAPLLKKQLTQFEGQLALESLWALNLIGELDETTALAALDHASAQVRLWTVRLLCDQGNVSPAVCDRLAKLARGEQDLEVSCQLACSARRLPANDCLRIIRDIIQTHDASDIRLPLLVWWAIEAKVAASPSEVVDFFREPASWRAPIVERDIAERLMRRFAATGRRNDLSVCAELLKLASNPDDVKRLMAGFEAAYAGRPLTNLPDELTDALEKFSGSSVVLGLRQGRTDSVQEALSALADERADKAKQLQYVQILGEVSQPQCIPALIKLAITSPDNALQSAALRSLGRYDDSRIPPAVLSAFANTSDDVRATASALLASREKWTLALLDAVDSGQLEKSWVPAHVIGRMSLFSNSRASTLIQKLWPDFRPASSDELRKEIERVAGILPAGIGQPKAGKAIYSQQCSKCHALFGQGGGVGPDLTSFNRNDIQAMLLSIVHPSAEIREGYDSYLVLTADGRALTGTLAEQDAQTVTLCSPDDTLIAIPRDEIDEMTVSKQSIMPDGLLKSYSDQELRDLFAYLRMTQPLID
ncbi:MAG TPA: PVC-type heme-binding CxxCH protein [Lacipirellulaceae bacterium]|jgi:putative heme-binding domain-containing protein|nr:PVC-type heme-binding CxxCH protein [Lacipirellulaceae bacterium]